MKFRIVSWEACFILNMTRSLNVYIKCALACTFNYFHEHCSRSRFPIIYFKEFKTRESISFAIEYEFITYIERLLQKEHRKGYKKIYFISALYLNIW